MHQSKFLNFWFSFGEMSVQVSSFHDVDSIFLFCNYVHHSTEFSLDEISRKEGN